MFVSGDHGKICTIEEEALPEFFWQFLTTPLNKRWVALAWLVQRVQGLWCLFTIYIGEELRTFSTISTIPQFTLMFNLMRRKCEKSGRKRKLIKVKRLKKNRDQNIILKCDKDYCVYHKQTEGYTWNACVFFEILYLLLLLFLNRVHCITWESKWKF